MGTQAGSSPNDDARRTPLARLAGRLGEVDGAVDGLLRLAALPHGRRAAAMLLRRWETLAPDQRRRLLERREAVDGAIASLAASSDDGDRLAAARVAGRVGTAAAVDAACRLARDGRDEAAWAAGTALRRFVEAMGSLDAPARAALDGGLAGLCAAYSEHRRRAALDAAAGVADRAGPRLRAWLESDDEAGLMALRGVVKSGEGPAARAQAARLLAVPSLAPASASALGRRADGRSHEAALRLGHLIGLRGRGAALRRLRDPLAALPGQDGLEGLTIEARLGAQRWALAAPAASARRAAALVEMSRDPSPAVRLACAARLAGLSDATSLARDGLAALAFDDDARVARAAIEGLDAERRDAALSRLERSPVGEVRALAAARRAGSETAGVRALVGDGTAASMLRLRRALARDRFGALAGLRGAIAEGAVGARIGAIRAAVRLGVADEVSAEIVGATEDGDARVAATAALALGGVNASSARSALAACLGHPDGRVRASALEAIAVRSPGAPAVRGALEADHPRLRANALRAWLRSGGGDGGEALERMLADGRAEHRRSALWVAERVGAVGASARVAALARGDESEAVRRRARRCAGRLLARMRVNGSRPETPAA